MITPGSGRPVRASWRVGAGAAAVIAAIYIVTAIVVRVPKDTDMFSDEWTYAMMGLSAAYDGDLAYRAIDLQRVLAMTPSGPLGVYLKPGRDVTGIRLTARPPFVAVDGGPDPDGRRLFFGKAFIYPLFASPFVRLFGLNGFLWFNALLLGLGFFAAHVFVGARSNTLVSLLTAGAFLMATVVPVYAAWLMPELFNFTLGVVAYVCWLYKYVAPVGVAPRWLSGRGSDVAAAVILGIAAYSKPSNALLFAPMALWLVWRREWRRALVTALVWGLVTGGLFAANVAVTGDWNYQGAPRHIFYQRSDNLGRAYPFQAPGVDFNAAAGAEMERSETLGSVIFDRELFWSNLGANLEDPLVGRYGGLIPYFFPTVLGVLMLLSAGRRRESWQWFVLGGLLAHLLLFVVTQPYTYLGSAGSVGNRYFMGAYGMTLFLFPPIQSVVAPLAAWAVGAVFIGKIVIHPFHYSLRPFEPAKTGPLRIFPVELTQLNDSPPRNEAHRVRVPYGETGAGDRGFQIYHFDDNAYLPEEGHKTFWTRGKARAEMVFKTDTAVDYRYTNLHLSSGPIANEVIVKVGAETYRVTLAAGEEKDLRVPLGPPFVYGVNKLESGQANFVWTVSIETTDGFTPPPRPDGSPGDVRYLGVLVKPSVWP